MLLDALNSSKLFAGIMVLVLNLGSRHLVDEISTSQEEYSRNLMMRRLAIFAVCFVTTRDIIISILLTAGFVILASGFSRRSSEGMANKDPGVSKADAPAYDVSAPLLFTAL
jgi:hypothetical protein